MTQQEFNTLLTGAKATLAVLLDQINAEKVEGGYYTSKYSGEEMDALLDKVSDLT